MPFALRTSGEGTPIDIEGSDSSGPTYRAIFENENRQYFDQLGTHVFH